ncbi:hypothetical protein BFJ68_g15478 [Fusarium oxysporum]|uniref:ADP-ribosylation factor n=1 Tax=Fusarium oxysporum TaxID=5507 RepID=A0A420PM88_FUSOX|nr:hypothetical protein BFJ68_g15478 [Fusarium oxysporum]
MPEQQQQGRQQNTNLLIHDMFRGGDDTTVHWEPTSHPVAVAWPVECLVSREAKRHCITQQDVNNLVDFDSLEYAAVEITPVFQGNQQFKLFDYAGNPHWRPCWRSFMSRLRGVVFVIDSTDREALQEVKVELVGLLKEEMLEQQPFLVLANKQDDPKAMSAAELTEYLDIQQYLDKSLKCRVQPTSALTGEGLAAGLDWVRNALREHRE